MDKYHINAEGNPGKCSAKVKCPFGGDEAHYFSKEAAQKAFEDATKSEALKVWKKKVVHAPEAEPTSSQSGGGIGHGGFHGKSSAAPASSPATGYGFHGATTPSKPKAAPAKRAPMTGHGGFHGHTTMPSTGHGGYGVSRGGHGF